MAHGVTLSLYVELKAESTPFGVDTESTSVTPTSLHDDFVNMMKSQGLEKMATEIGILKNGVLVEAPLPATPCAATLASARSGSGKKRVATASTLANQSFTSPCVAA